MTEQILKLEFLEMIAKQVREDLERDALRTIRQKDTEKGKACLDKIEGVDQFMDAIQRACQHGFYRQAGLVKDAEPVAVLRSHSAPQVISPRKKRAG
jgi:hypothetical protein